jgi:hypothetical protein
MTAALLMTPEQVIADPGRWKARRRRTDDGRWCVTASEIAAVCGVAPESRGGPFAMYWKKINAEETEDTEELERGRALEPLVLRDFRLGHDGLALLDGGLYAHGDDPRWLATFDGQAIEHDTLVAFTDRWGQIPESDIAVVEAKTSIPTEDFGWEEDSAQVPVHIRAQVLWQMFVRGAVRAYVVVKFMRSWKTRTYIIDLDARAKDETAWLIAQAEEFTGRLDRLDPPAPDWFPADTQALWEMYPGSRISQDRVRIPWALAKRYRACLAAGRWLEVRKGLVKNEILSRAGDAGTVYAIDPATGREVKIATRTAGGRDGYWVRPREGNQVNPAGWAKQKTEREKARAELGS